MLSWIRCPNGHDRLGGDYCAICTPKDASDRERRREYIARKATHTKRKNRKEGKLHAYPVYDHYRNDRGSMNDDQRFPEGEWVQIKTAIRLGVSAIELAQNTQSAREAQRNYTDAQREFSWLLSKLTELLALREK